MRNPSSRVPLITNRTDHKDKHSGTQTTTNPLKFAQPPLANKYLESTQEDNAGLPNQIWRIPTRLCQICRPVASVPRLLAQYYHRLADLEVGLRPACPRFECLNVRVLQLKGVCPLPPSPHCVCDHRSSLCPVRPLFGNHPIRRGVNDKLIVCAPPFTMKNVLGV